MFLRLASALWAIVFGVILGSCIAQAAVYKLAQHGVGGPEVNNATTFSLSQATTISAADAPSTTSSRPSTAQVNPGKKISTGASGQVKYGFNIHSWPMASVSPMLQELGAKVLRISVSYGLYLRAGAYPGTNNFNAVAQATVDAAVAQGMDVLLAITNPIYPPTDEAMAQWPTFVQAVAAANVKNSNVIFELGNEPNYTKMTAQQYFDVMRVSSPALKNGDPNAKMSMPVINASYTQSAQKFVAQLMAMPGVFNLFDYGDFHPYYNSPETSYFIDLDAFIRSIDVPAAKAGKSIEFVVSEVGWSNATGLMPAPGIGNSHLQTLETAADFYSRYIPISRATHKLRKVIFYGLVDEGPPDPNLKDPQGHFGVFEQRPRRPKPAAAVARDLIAHVHRAIGAEMYTRAGILGRDDTTANWFVRLDTPQNHELIAWSVVNGGRADKIVINAQQVGILSMNVAGDSPTQRPLAQGLQVVDVFLGARSVILSSDVPIDFPEFK